MRFGLPESLGLSSYTFSFHVPMPGAYPSSPPPKALGLRKELLLRQRPRIVQREERRRGPGPLELALQQIGDRESPDEDEPSPQKVPHYHKAHGMQEHGPHNARERIIYIGGLPQSITRNEIVARMSRVGKLKSCVLNCGRGYVGRDNKIDFPGGEYMATVEFTHVADAAKAVRRHHQTKWLDRTIVVSFNPWDMPTGRRLRGLDVNRLQPADKNPRPTPHGAAAVRDTTASRRNATLWRYTQDRRRKRDEEVEQKRAERLKQHLGGGWVRFKNG